MIALLPILIPIFCANSDRTKQAKKKSPALSRAPEEECEACAGPYSLLMSILTWNVRGLNKKERRHDIIHHISKYQPSLVALVETKVRECKSSRVVKCLPKGWSHCNSHKLFKSRQDMAWMESTCLGLYCHVFFLPTENHSSFKCWWFEAYPHSGLCFKLAKQKRRIMVLSCK